jgi:DNA replication protein DnaC
MYKIDKAILDINKSICKNIDKFDDSERGLLSQNILTKLRHFVEHISLKAYSDGEDLPVTYDNLVEGNKFVSRIGKYKFLNKFHKLLQISVSHYMVDEGSAERLMLKYYEHLLKIKQFLKNDYNLDVLENIEDFPVDTNGRLMEYYHKIVEKIDMNKSMGAHSAHIDRYYINKVKPIFVNNSIYYEITCTIANDKGSKFDRVIAFTKLDILSNYAVRLIIRNDSINILGKRMPIQIIEKWEASIRPCELYNFSKIFGLRLKLSGSSREYKELMSLITNTKMSLVDLIDYEENYYNFIKSKINGVSSNKVLFEIFDICRELSRGKEPGSNIIRYLLLKMNNTVIKKQYAYNGWSGLSGLYLNYGCMPFDKMPFNSSLKNHNPRLYDLLECIDPNEREHEFIARLIKNNTEQDGKLFTSKEEITKYENVDELIRVYNSKLYYKHEHRKIMEFKKNLYIKGYSEDSIFIINKLREMCEAGINNYTNSVNYWYENNSYTIDCVQKKSILANMFEESKVALIYGAAGTGKSTLINHISTFFNDKKKMFLANTNPAIDNLRRKVKVANCDFKTITKFLSNWNTDVNYDLLIIDECSTVSNSDMVNILNKANFKLLVLVGDIFQIESIKFGNWFSLAKTLIKESAIYELSNPYRSTSYELLNIWNSVRRMDDDVLEHIARNNISVNLDDTIFDYSEDDQIILCLNYDGLYGINNINSFLQEGNSNASVQWGINTYKVNDPILFNESERFAPLIYNNMKGRIVNINVSGDDNIIFDIELDMRINELDADGYSFELVGVSERGNSIISFMVNKLKSTDEDDDLFSDVIVPFQVAYAVSIHKAQGLEYNSVKIVINDEIDELVTHNIFYTAITRAKEKLKIYWTPETENRILSNLRLKNINKDVALLKAKYDC